MIVDGGTGPIWPDAREWLKESRLYYPEDDQGGLGVYRMINALLAVLDLHRPVEYDVGGAKHCWGCGMGMRSPCPTEQAINRALGVES